jgi:hypothetical protein
MQYGIDVGRSGVKVTSHGSRIFLPSMISPATADGWALVADRRRVTEVNGVRRFQSLILSYNGERWMIGDEQQRMGYSCVNPMGVTKADPMTRLLIIGGLAATGIGEVAEICVGLPTAMFDTESPRMLELMRGEHRFGVDGVEQLVKVKTLIVPEGLGLLVWSCRSEHEGIHLPTLKQSTVVVDFGHRTTQLSLFRGIRLAPIGFTLNQAMGQVFESVFREAVDEQLKMPFSPAMHGVMAQDLIWNGSVTVNGLHIQYAGIVPSLQAEARKVWPEIRAAIGRALAGVMYERVVAGGGGVHLLEDELREFFGSEVLLVTDRYAQAAGYAHCLTIRKHLMEA